LVLPRRWEEDHHRITSSKMIYSIAYWLTRTSM
jgi:hypothetical protein